MSCPACECTASVEDNIRVGKIASKHSFAGAADDSEGIEDILQLLPEAVRDAVQACLSADAEDTWSPEVSRSAFRVPM